MSDCDLYSPKKLYIHEPRAVFSFFSSHPSKRIQGAESRVSYIALFNVQTMVNVDERACANRENWSIRSAKCHKKHQLSTRSNFEAGSLD